MLNLSYDAFNKENRAIQIYHGNSSVDSYFDLIAPFEITYEFCSGTSSYDYINVFTLSPDYIYSLPTPHDYFLHAPYFNNRPLHRHSYFETVIVLNGTIVQKIEDTEIRCPSGSCYILNKNLRHAENFIGEASILLIGLSSEFVKDILFDDMEFFFKNEKQILTHPLLDFFNECNNTSGEKAYLSFSPQKNQHTKLLKELHSLTDLLIQTLLFPRYGSTHVLKGLIGLLFHYLFSDEYYIQNKHFIHSNAEFLLFSKITQLLQEKNGRICNEELADKLHYSSNYLNRIVKKYTEICLFDYRMYFCMQEAAHLLTSTTMSIADISQTLGFTNRTHFYKRFRKIYHMTPKEYRSLSNQNKH